jgi:hypothetical protein
MEIRLQGTAIACVAQEDIKAGLAVKLGAAAGKSLPDVIIGASLPTADDDIDAKYVAAFRVYNEPTPIYESLPTLDTDGNTTGVPYTVREWPQGVENLPATIKLRMVPPRLKTPEETILSGAMMLAYDEGIYTVTSGCYYGASFITGQAISVKGSAENGKWYQDDGGKVAEVFEFNSTKGELTIKTLGIGIAGAD